MEQDGGQVEEQASGQADELAGEQAGERVGGQGEKQAAGTAKVPAKRNINGIYLVHVDLLADTCFIRGSFVHSAKSNDYINYI